MLWVEELTNIFNRTLFKLKSLRKKRAKMDPEHNQPEAISVTVYITPGIASNTVDSKLPTEEVGCVLWKISCAATPCEKSTQKLQLLCMLRVSRCEPREGKAQVDTGCGSSWCRMRSQTTLGESLKNLVIYLPGVCTPSSLSTTDGPKWIRKGFGSTAPAALRPAPPLRHHRAASSLTQCTPVRHRNRLFSMFTHCNCFSFNMYPQNRTIIYYLSCIQIIPITTSQVSLFSQGFH